ncbi:hypothetical protein NDU88_010033 [Pleurodeles waltl]|uniref:Uncharacterized protein n=1 Tax=Pleurodeles waltl TaxID=8319 RepID=A0AAV7RWZ4_PLEWA|nr:hypothetical protein NDU88_010033 [Pleurodeles waltl]
MHSKLDIPLQTLEKAEVAKGKEEEDGEERGRSVPTSKSEHEEEKVENQSGSSPEPTGEVSAVNHGVSVPQLTGEESGANRGVSATQLTGEESAGETGEEKELQRQARRPTTSLEGLGLFRWVNGVRVFKDSGGSGEVVGRSGRVEKIVKAHAKIRNI